MTPKELKDLHGLLGKFIKLRTSHSSIYGRKMDIAIATDLRSVLFAYGLKPSMVPVKAPR